MSEVPQVLEEAVRRVAQALSAARAAVKEAIARAPRTKDDAAKRVRMALVEVDGAVDDVWRANERALRDVVLWREETPFAQEVRRLGWELNGWGLEPPGFVAIRASGDPETPLEEVCEPTEQALLDTLRARAEQEGGAHE